MQSGAREGGWVVLQNLHHALDWLPTLANIITRLYTEGVPNGGGGGGGGARKANGNGGLHPNFRLILTTEPTDEVGGRGQGAGGTGGVAAGRGWGWGSVRVCSVGYLLYLVMTMYDIYPLT